MLWYFKTLLIVNVHRWGWGLHDKVFSCFSLFKIFFNVMYTILVTLLSGYLIEWVGIKLKETDDF